MKKKILILFAHPRLERSKNHALLLKHIPENESITFHDLYEQYPDYNIDVPYEKELLAAHDIIVWQHPFYWYSAPPLLKQWIDMVLEFGWAYGPGGKALKDKIVFNAITTGGQKEAYTPTGNNKYTIKQFLAPMERTVMLCKMHYFPPFVIHGTHKISSEDLEQAGKSYAMILEQLLEGNFNANEMLQYEYLNDWWKAKNNGK